jgi:hypothetical protein
VTEDAVGETPTDAVETTALPKNDFVARLVQIVRFFIREYGIKTARLLAGL